MLTRPENFGTNNRLWVPRLSDCGLVCIISDLTYAQSGMWISFDAVIAGGASLNGPLCWDAGGWAEEAVKIT